MPDSKIKGYFTAIEVEPEDGKYWAYFRPPKVKWYLDRVIAVGSTIEDMPQGNLDSMQQQANGIYAKAEFVAWRKPSMPFGIPKGSADFVFLADGGVRRLGDRLERAMVEIERVLKPGGRFFIAADEKDELILGMRLDTGWAIPSDCALSKVNLKMVASQRDSSSELVFAQFRKSMKRKLGASGRSSKARRK